MKNHFEIRGDHVAIFLQKIDDLQLETLISLEDLPRVIAEVSRLRGVWKHGIAGYYVIALLRDSDKEVHFARFIAGTPKGFQVDHKFHNTLDNRRSELRNVTPEVNNLNRRFRREDAHRTVKRTIVEDQLRGVVTDGKVNVRMEFLRAWGHPTRNEVYGPGNRVRVSEYIAGILEKNGIAKRLEDSSRG